MLKVLKVALAASVVCSSLSVSAADISVRTAKGDAVVPASPETIVVYDLLSLDTLDALGVQLKGKPVKTYVDYIDNFVANPVPIGASSQPNYEAVVKMNPDLFVIGGGSSKLMEPLSKIAPTIDMFVRGHDHVDQMIARLEDLAKLTNKEEKAAQLKADFFARLEEAKKAVAGKGKTLIVMTNGGKLSTYGAHSRFGWLFTDVGLEESVKGVDDKTHGESISYEFIAKANPDYILVVDRSAAIGRKSEAAAVTLDNALVKGTKAAKEGNMIFLSPGPAYTTGGAYQGMMIMLEEIIQGYKS
ncbi:siderophore ABC transporter substrate-binding protein [Marinomonas sp. C2222]|uniref:Siderophore ABC transporter substrate-binding protein n=1 Tax=Marinomonas sargassi TaxID=2984494 RepID=A0ABT2YUQ2_9GAMM|nr:siderophore ABC transporter substrate-binding protein [Marinomonas sargassi]MCV2403621.1 siderophore ABC transporter substrate-binding protein [Marinomonas sargassi]